MARFSVEPTDLQCADALLASAAAATRTALAYLVATAEAVLGSAWQGGAAGAFRLAWEQWLDGVTATVETLDDLARAVGASGADYAGTDSSVGAAVARAST